MEKEYSAGGLLLNKENKVYFILDKRGEWSLPKGKLNSNENTLTAAIRELKEETGYQDFELLYKYPFYTSHYQYSGDNKSIDKYVTYYVFHLKSESYNKTQEMIDEGLAGEWLNIEDAINKATYPQTKTILLNFKKTLENNNLDLILLGGMGLHNLDWIQEASENFGSKIKNSQIIYYEHWNNPNLSMDLNTESQKLRDVSQNQTNFSIFAKSAGIATTLKTIKDFDIKPTKCIFVGLPLNMVNETDPELLSNLKNVNFPLYFFQNTHDPFTSFEETKNFLNNLDLKNISIIEEQGDTHNYLNYDKYLEKILN